MRYIRTFSNDADIAIMLKKSTPNYISVLKEHKMRHIEQCLKYIHRIENVIYGENSKIVYHYLCVNLDINELDFSVEGIKPIYLMIQLIEGFASILKKNLLLY